MSDKYDAIAEKIVAHGYLKKDEIAYIIRTELSGKTGELEAKPAPVPSADCAQDMRLMDGAMLAQTEELSVKALQDAIWIIDKIASGKEATKAIDLIKRVKDAIETGELKIEPPCQIKPASVPSAEELLDRITDSEYIKGDWSTDAEKALDEALAIIESAFAAQRQAGRKEAWNHQDVIELNERYSALETAARDASKWIALYAVGPGVVEISAKISKALDELGKARKGEGSGNSI